MWILIIIICLIVLFTIFYTKGKEHEKRMNAEAFANEMMVETVGDYPDSIGQKILTTNPLNQIGWNESTKHKSSSRHRSHNGSQSHSQYPYDNAYTNGEEGEGEESDDEELPTSNGGRQHHNGSGSGSGSSSTNINTNTNTNINTNTNTNINVNETTNYEDEDPEQTYNNNNYLKPCTGGNCNQNSNSNSNSSRNNKHNSSYKQNDIQNFKDFFVEPDPSILAPYGFVYMPNTLWSVPQRRPPVCLKENSCQVQPVMLGNPYSPLFEYTGSGSIMPTFMYRETPDKTPGDKQKYLQLLSERKVWNPNYFYPGYYGYSKILDAEVQDGRPTM